MKTEEQACARSRLLAAVTHVVDVLHLNDPYAIPPIAVEAVYVRLGDAVPWPPSPGEIRHALALRIAEVHPPDLATGDHGAEGEPF
jgi:hypothetical protein